MTKQPTYTPHDPTNAAHSVADSAIDKQTGGGGEQAKATRATLKSMNDSADAAIKRQTSGGSGTP